MLENLGMIVNNWDIYRLLVYLEIIDLQDAKKIQVRQTFGEVNFSWWNWDELYKIKGSQDSFWLALWFAYLEPTKYIDCFK